MSGTATAQVPMAFPAGALFDLDGTLLDSAPDMLATVNRMRDVRGRPPLALADIRPVVSRGARAMAAVAFPELDAEGVVALVPEFLAVYGEELGRHSRPFAGIEAMLAALEAAGTRWGIVTNKPEGLAQRILPQLGWQDRCAVLIGGDTLAERKPHPLPLLHAASAIGVPARDCVYVGDDARDILAARAAGMPSIVALWGYRLDDDDPIAWQGDAMLDTPDALLRPAAWPRPI
ncbi:phosphoglycolate phosphatase [Luteimonas sp. RC10]|nr:phosphoglycolate phosphatase [Luteimonas sp. RC10]